MNARLKNQSMIVRLKTASKVRGSQTSQRGPRKKEANEEDLIKKPVRVGLTNQRFGGGGQINQPIGRTYEPAKKEGVTNLPVYAGLTFS